MGLLKSEGIVLKTYPLNNSDKIVVVYSRDFGKFRGVAKGAQRAKSKFAGCFEPLSYLEMVFFEKENRELVSIDSADLIRSFSCHIREYGQFLKMLFVVELVFETVHDRERNEPLFRLMLLILAEMEKAQRVDLALVYFEVWFLKLSGLFPSLRTCPRCGQALTGAAEIGFEIDPAGFYCAACRAHGCFRIGALAHALLRMILSSKLDQIGEKIVNGQSLTDLSSACEAFLKRNFERDFDSLKLIDGERILST